MATTQDSDDEAAGSSSDMNNPDEDSSFHVPSDPFQQIGTYPKDIAGSVHGLGLDHPRSMFGECKLRMRMMVQAMLQKRPAISAPSHALCSASSRFSLLLVILEMKYWIHWPKELGQPGIQQPELEPATSLHFNPKFAIH